MNAVVGWDFPTLAYGRGVGRGRGDRHCGSLGTYVLCGTASLENLPNTLQKIRKTLKSVRAIFNVFSRYRWILGEHMKNRENDKFDSGRIHPGIYKNKECVLPLSTR